MSFKYKRKQLPGAVILFMLGSLLIAMLFNVFMSSRAKAQVFEPPLQAKNIPGYDRLQIPPEMCRRQFQAVGSVADQTETHWVSMCNYAKVLWQAASTRRGYSVSVYTVARFSEERWPVAGFVVSSPQGKIGCFFRLGQNDIFTYVGAFTTLNPNLPEGYYKPPPGSDYRTEMQKCLRGIGYYAGLQSLGTTTAPALEMPRPPVMAYVQPEREIDDEPDYYGLRTDPVSGLTHRFLSDYSLYMYGRGY